MVAQPPRTRPQLQREHHRCHQQHRPQPVLRADTPPEAGKQRHADGALQQVVAQCHAPGRDEHAQHAFGPWAQIEQGEDGGRSDAQCQRRNAVRHAQQVAGHARTQHWPCLLERIGVGIDPQERGRQQQPTEGNRAQQRPVCLRLLKQAATAGPVAQQEAAEHEEQQCPVAQLQPCRQLQVVPPRLRQVAVRQCLERCGVHLRARCEQGHPFADPRRQQRRQQQGDEQATAQQGTIAQVPEQRHQQADHRPITSSTAIRRRWAAMLPGAWPSICIATPMPNTSEYRVIAFMSTSHSMPVRLAWSSAALGSACCAASVISASSEKKRRLTRNTPSSANPRRASMRGCRGGRWVMPCSVPDR
ncbi:hypothetical protein G6F22_014524 [Rhizopus arrhizus]|nr:hypothetical protein G6F22_014524 [Rhizopus arrhizus]